MIAPDSPWFAVLLLSGGLIVGFAMGWLAAGGRKRFLAQTIQDIETRHQRETEALLDGVKLAFGDISTEAHRRVSEQLLQIAQTAMAAERRVQGQELEGRFASVTGQLDKMQGLVRGMEQARAAQLGELQQQLQDTGQAARELFASTHELRLLLSGSSKRGQWGERLAEDLLNRAGLIEGVNYRRQMTLGSNGRRPDFTFTLPDERLLHMDVKFPFENWLRAGESSSIEDRKRYETAFGRDVRRAMVEMAERGYSGSASGSVDVAIMLIPNEPAFVAAMTLEPQLLDDAMRRKIVLASPHSLIAILAVIREAVRCFALAHAGRELLAAMEVLQERWSTHQSELEKIGQALDQANKRFVRLGDGRDVADALGRVISISAGNQQTR